MGTRHLCPADLMTKMKGDRFCKLIEDDTMMGVGRNRATAEKGLRVRVERTW
jgi:hypothetical protein